MHFVLWGLNSATEQLRGELYKSEVLLITSTQLVVKAKNTYQNTIKMHKTMETELIHYMDEHNVCSVTNHLRAVADTFCS